MYKIKNLTLLCAALALVLAGVVGLACYGAGMFHVTLDGVAASSGSACTSGSLDPSHVLLAIGLPHEIAHGSLRFSLSEDNTMEEVDYVVDELKPIVEKLRAMSPLYNK